MDLTKKSYGSHYSRHIETDDEHFFFMELCRLYFVHRHNAYRWREIIAKDPNAAPVNWSCCGATGLPEGQTVERNKCQIDIMEDMVVRRHAELGVHYSSLTLGDYLREVRGEEPIIGERRYIPEEPNTNAPTEVARVIGKMCPDDIDDETDANDDNNNDDDGNDDEFNQFFTTRAPKMVNSTLREVTLHGKYNNTADDEDDDDDDDCHFGVRMCMSF